MNVEQYLAQELGITNQDMMGDEMPLDSNCGHACKLAIDAAKQLIDEMKSGTNIYDCDSRYAFLGHIVNSLGDNEEMKTFFNDPSPETIKDIAVGICGCYIFG